jgi:hypothetical protein
VKVELAGKVGTLNLSDEVVTHLSPARRSSKFLRSCIDCRKRENPMGLLRVVCVEGRILPDPHRSLPGRGAWVHRKCAVRAVERGAFRWAFRRDEHVDGSELLTYINNYEMDAKDMTLK